MQNEAISNRKIGTRPHITTTAPAMMGARMPEPLCASDIMPAARPYFSLGIMVLIAA